MKNLSINQLLDVWTQLETSLHGENSFGGTTAEIYAYTLMASSPMYNAFNNQESSFSEDINLIDMDALQSLKCVIDEFVLRHENVNILIYGVEYKAYFNRISKAFKADSTSFPHRYHVTVVKGEIR